MTKITDEFKKDLAKYISFKSISTDAAYLGEIEKTIFWLKSYIENAGGKVEFLQKGKTNPVVVGEINASEKSNKTILLYGHYDVQPGEKADGWSSENPFILEEKFLDQDSKKEKRLVARGVVDNKGQNFIHLYTVCKLAKEGKLKYNVKIVLEGNEETGNLDLPEILKENKEKFKADYVLVSDGEIFKNFPVIDSSLRGGANIKVVLETGKNNLHSGIFGGAVPSASTEIVKLLNTFKDSKNNVLVKDFYKNIIWPNKKILDNNKNLGTEKDAIKLAGVKQLLTLKKFDFYTQTGCLPTLEFSGIKTGYIGEGFANIVPGSAEVRINVRIVAGQKVTDILAVIKKHILKNIPKYAKVKIEMENLGDAVKLDSECEVANNIKMTLEKAYNKKVLYKYVGGSIPILGDFQKILKTKVISVSLGNDDCNMHGVDENFKVDLIEKGLSFANSFWSK
jgi:acetylornithine deacetylase/succinyl-diaminopimelate desuccinylase-like protein